MKTKHILFAVLFLLCTAGITRAQITAPKSYGPIPARQQIDWQEMEYYAFVYLSTNTFTDQE